GKKELAKAIAKIDETAAKTISSEKAQ
ncbi:hypothetical protein ADUPG1_005651, partial [Aduncisulcus paluster]